MSNLGGSRGFTPLALLIYGSIIILTVFTGILGYKEYKLKMTYLNPGTSHPTFTAAPSTPTSIPTPTLTPRPRILDGGRLFNLVNQYRSKNGLSQILWFHPLCEYSRERSKQISTDWSHEGFTKDAESSLLYQYCPDCVRVGENLAEGYTTEDQILNAWIKSPTHKENLDYDWNYACAYFYGNKYVSIIFGKKN